MSQTLTRPGPFAPKVTSIAPSEPSAPQFLFIRSNARLACQLSPTYFHTKGLSNGVHFLVSKRNGLHNFGLCTYTPHAKRFPKLYTTGSRRFIPIGTDGGARGTRRRRAEPHETETRRTDISSGIDQRSRHFLSSLHTHAMHG